jgi:exosortase A
MTSRDRNLHLLLAVLLACIGWQYRETFGSIVHKWQDDAAFSHGMLIVPVSLWLVWRKRNTLADTPAAPSWWGAIAMLACVAAWLVARGTGVLVVEQFAAVAMIPAAVLAVLGPRVAAVLIFPLAFLLFAVPFGRGIVPWLMQVTADLGTWALRLTGVPVYRSHMHISIPAGEFEVARACSGLNYFITGLVLGVLYAYLTYSSWKKRLLCVMAFIVVPVLMNGARVYIIVLTSHLTDMRFGPGTEHIVFGRAFFLVIMFVMFWIGRRWRDDEATFQRSGAQRSGATVAPRPAWAAVPAAAILAFAGPTYLASSSAGARASQANAGSIVRLPDGSGGWSGPSSEPAAWRPHFSGALAELQGRYRLDAAGQVDIYVGLYGIGTTAGAEMITFGNRIFPNESGSLARSTKIEIARPDGESMEVLQFEGRSVGQSQLVWTWYVIGERRVLSPYAVKVREAVSLLTRNTVTERVVTIATVSDSGAHARLEAFVRAHANCVRASFASGACGG